MKHSFYGKLGKFFLAISAGLWAGCGDDSSTSPSSSNSLEGAKVNVDEAVARLETVDTTGLRGKSIDRFEYCNMVDSFSMPSGAETAQAEAQQQQDIFLKSESGARISAQEKACLQNAVNDMMAIYPAYGVMMCEEGDKVIDDAYLNAMINKHESRVNGVREKLEQYNKNVDACI